MTTDYDGASSCTAIETDRTVRRYPRKKTHKQKRCVDKFKVNLLQAGTTGRTVNNRST